MSHGPQSTMAAPAEGRGRSPAGAAPESGTGPWRPQELAAASGLAQMVRRLPLSQDGSPDTDSASGRVAMSCLLRSLDLASRELGVALAPRDYCAGLTERHRARWTQPGCLYSLQVLASSFLCPGISEGHNEVVVNGQTFQLSQHCARLSGRLRRCWADVFWLLKQLRKLPAETWEAPQQASLRKALGALDHAWAAFEERFFAELKFYDMQVLRDVPSAYLVRGFRSTVAAARNGGGGGGGGGWWASTGGGAQEAASGYGSNCSRQLVDYISQLNVALNPGCTGRTFGAEVLMAAKMVVESGQAGKSYQQGAVLDPACLFRPLRNRSVRQAV
ncbi:unnamed protein product [Prorocentrum cordatum]|uniref:Uncharacterized protein n=1 Tax=Prorocentrum cordatum TaxID=2364126 RepID=A0ABN9PQ15_9DINO|nr:unnamed protein product [Polarella glacialis]